MSRSVCDARGPSHACMVDPGVCSRSAAVNTRSGLQYRARGGAPVPSGGGRLSGRGPRRTRTRQPQGAHPVAGARVRTGWGGVDRSPGRRAVGRRAAGEAVRPGERAGQPAAGGAGPTHPALRCRLLTAVRLAGSRRTARTQPRGRGSAGRWSSCGRSCGVGVGITTGAGSGARRRRCAVGAGCTRGDRAGGGRGAAGGSARRARGASVRGGCGAGLGRDGERPVRRGCAARRDARPRTAGSTGFCARGIHDVQGTHRGGVRCRPDDRDGTGARRHRARLGSRPRRVRGDGDARRSRRRAGGARRLAGVVGQRVDAGRGGGRPGDRQVRAHRRVAPRRRAPRCARAVRPL